MWEKWKRVEVSGGEDDGVEVWDRVGLGGACQMKGASVGLEITEDVMC